MDFLFLDEFWNLFALVLVGEIVVSEASVRLMRLNVGNFLLLRFEEGGRQTGASG